MTVELIVHHVHLLCIFPLIGVSLNFYLVNQSEKANVGSVSFLSYTTYIYKFSRYIPLPNKGTCLM